jgi:hypothetical protein
LVPRGPLIGAIKYRNHGCKSQRYSFCLPVKSRAWMGILAARLADSKSDIVEGQRIAALIERYASQALAAPVREHITGPAQAPIEVCEISSHLLAYLLRVDEPPPWDAAKRTTAQVLFAPRPDP